MSDTVVYRNLWFRRVRRATPMRIVEETDQRVVLWHPLGVRERVSDTGGMPRDWRLVEKASPDEVIVVYERGAMHAVYVARNAEGLRCWYVNFEDPWDRSAIGYDTRDLFLDIWVNPDRTWEFLDEDELEEAGRERLLTAAEVAATRAEGARVAAAVGRWDAPFRDGWESWQADPSWPTPELPEGWDVV